MARRDDSAEPEETPTPHPHPQAPPAQHSPASRHHQLHLDPVGHQDPQHLLVGTLLHTAIGGRGWTRAHWSAHCPPRGPHEAGLQIPACSCHVKYPAVVLLIPLSVKAQVLATQPPCTVLLSISPLTPLPAPRLASKACCVWLCRGVGRGEIQPLLYEAVAPRGPASDTWVVHLRVFVPVVPSAWSAPALHIHITYSLGIFTQNPPLDQASLSLLPPSPFISPMSALLFLLNTRH